MILMELSLLAGNNSSVQVSHDSNSNSPNEEDEHANGSARTRSKDLSATQRQQTIIPHEHIAKVLLLVAFEEGGHHNLVKADEDVMVHWIDASKHLVQARLHLRGELSSTPEAPSIPGALFAVTSMPAAPSASTFMPVAPSKATSSMASSSSESGAKTSPWLLMWKPARPIRHPRTTIQPPSPSNRPPCPSIWPLCTASFLSPPRPSSLPPWMCWWNWRLPRPPATPPPEILPRPCPAIGTQD